MNVTILPLNNEPLKVMYIFKTCRAPWNGWSAHSLTSCIVMVINKVLYKYTTVTLCRTQLFHGWLWNKIRSTQEYAICERRVRTWKEQAPQPVVCSPKNVETTKWMNNIITQKVNHKQEFISSPCHKTVSTYYCITTGI